MTREDEDLKSHERFSLLWLETRHLGSVLMSFLFSSAQFETTLITDTDLWTLLSLRLINVSLIQWKHHWWWEGGGGGGGGVSGLQTPSDSRAAEQTAH